MRVTSDTKKTFKLAYIFTIDSAIVPKIQCTTPLNERQCFYVHAQRTNAIFNACNQRLHVVSFRAKMELSFYSINFTLQTLSTYLRAVLIGSGGVIFSINFFNSVAFLFEGLKPFSNVSSSILSRLMRIARLLEPLCLCECVWGGG